MISNRLTTKQPGSVIVLFFAFANLTLSLLGGPFILSGNENKIDLLSGTPTLIPNAPPDSLTLLDFETFPPKVTHIEDVPNTVIGPPSNIAITPNHTMALIANSIRVDPNDKSKWVPNKEIHLLDLQSNPPKIIGKTEAGLQPSGISITPDGKFALVANRAAGTISVLSIEGQKVQQVDEVKVCGPADSISDVAISPDSRLVLASVQKPGYLAVLTFQRGKLEVTGQKLSVYGQPYRCMITADGRLAVTAGSGFGNGIDRDAITLVDLAVKPIRTINYLPISVGPESLDVRMDGKMLAVVLMNGSNLPTDHPSRTRHGLLEIFLRRQKGFFKKTEIKIGPIPEGIAFTSDGNYLVVQCHPDRELWIFEVKGDDVRDTGHRVKVPGMPSSLRASP